MKPKGYPHPVSVLGDELNRVSDVNPCRKTGGGCPPWVPSGGYHFAVICIDRNDFVKSTDGFEIYCPTTDLNIGDTASLGIVDVAFSLTR